MKKVFLITAILIAMTSICFAQSFTMGQNNLVTGKSGTGLGFDDSTGKVIRSSFGNPPVIDVLNKDTLAVESTLATGSATYGTLAGFGMGVGADGTIVILDHIEDANSNNGLIRWQGITDTAPALITAASSVRFPRYVTILGTGTDQTLVCAGAAPGEPLNILRTTDGNMFTLAYSLGNILPVPTPETGLEYGGQRGSAAYVGSGTNEFPEMIFGCDSSTYPGIHYFTRGEGVYTYGGDILPTSTDSSSSILSIAVDPGFAASPSLSGQKPVLIAVGSHAGTGTGSAFYMFDLETKAEIAVLPFDAAGAEFVSYGAIGLDIANNRAYFTARDGANSTLGYVTYEAPEIIYVAPTPSPTPAISPTPTPFQLNANGAWGLYE